MRSESTRTARTSRQGPRHGPIERTIESDVQRVGDRATAGQGAAARPHAAPVAIDLRQIPYEGRSGAMIALGFTVSHPDWRLEVAVNQNPDADPARPRVHVSLHGRLLERAEPQYLLGHAGLGFDTDPRALATLRAVLSDAIDALDALHLAGTTPAATWPGPTPWAP